MSPTQINAQMPSEAQPGQVNLILTTGSVVLPAFLVNVAAIAPGFFMLPGGRGAVENRDYSVNTATNGAAPGSFLIAYFTGQGMLDNAVATGAPAAVSPLSRTAATTTATIGDQPATVVFSGLTPKLAGLAQAAILAPNLAPGDYPLVLIVGGQIQRRKRNHQGQLTRVSASSLEAGPYWYRPH